MPSASPSRGERRVPRPCFFSCALPCRATVKVDDEMVRHYCNEDMYVLQAAAAGPESGGLLTLTLVELDLLLPDQSP